MDESALLQWSGLGSRGVPLHRDRSQPKIDSLKYFRFDAKRAAIRNS